ncbi:hypothetical protein CLLI_24450 [Clostridium liquoris]|uniref:Uncharacterized protein n=1 Tax=Clostridium liquoris TaxID=1289519 RepID=A0A2T0B0Z8_9CLOT|nr:hypothetical protein [Clostridium liquoris]PRR77275.1 hypothetical protein CLLI_24450 [Clostridium liquoris]
MKYLKYILSLLLTFISYFIISFLILNLSKSPDGTVSDFSFIEVGITLIIAVIVGSTALIIATIKESNKK